MQRLSTLQAHPCRACMKVKICVDIKTSESHFYYQFALKLRDANKCD